MAIGNININIQFFKIRCLILCLIQCIPLDGLTLSYLIPCDVVHVIVALSWKDKISYVDLINSFKYMNENFHWANTTNKGAYITAVEMYCNSHLLSASENLSVCVTSPRLGWVYVWPRLAQAECTRDAGIDAKVSKKYV